MRNLRIVLASASPRRRELLRQIGWDFEVRVSDAEEKITASEPGKAVEQLSAQKAGAAAAQLTAEACKEGDWLVIGADTVVVCDGQILGKPSDEKDACAMLEKLQGRKHQVYTGVTMLFRKGETGETKASEDGLGFQEIVFHERTTVEFYPMTEKEIREYVACGEPADKAGAYGIQGAGARYIKGIEGDYNNVVGLPVGRLYQELAALYAE